MQPDSTTSAPAWHSHGSWLQLVAALLWLPQAWLLAAAIDSMTQPQQLWPSLPSVAIGLALIGISRSLLDAWGARLLFIAARRQVSSLRQTAIIRLMQRSPLDKLRPNSGSVASIVTEQAELLVPYLSRYKSVQLRVPVLPLIIAATVAMHSWLAALALLAAAPLIPLFMALIGFDAQKASQKQLLEIGQMNGFLLDRLRGLTSIRAFKAVDLIAQRLAQATEQVGKKTMAVLRIAFLSSAVLELFSALGVALIACYIGFHLLGESLQFGSWGTKLTLTQGLFILLLAPAFFEPLRELSAVWHDKAAGSAALAALKQLQQPGIQLVGTQQPSSATAINQPTSAGGLSLSARQLSFSFPEGATVLHNVSLQIAAGEKVALVAPSGQGKSTLLALLAGFLAPDQGCIEIGGVALTNASADNLRRRIGWLSQQPHVFPSTLLQNITLGRAQISTATLQQSLATAALTQVAQGRLEQPLAEGGSGLSGGEILRLALARALVTPQLGLLLADEPTAHLDVDSAQQVVDGLMAVAQHGVTLVIATHDQRLLAAMDQVIYLTDAGATAANTYAS